MAQNLVPKIKGIANVEVLQKFQDIFFSLTGLYTTIMDNNADFVTSARGMREYCRLIAGVEKRTGVSHCWKSNYDACREVLKKKKPLIYRCYAGLTEIIVPILINDNPIGAVITGQIRVKNSSPAKPTFSPKGREALYEKMKGAYNSVPELTQSQLHSAAELLFLLINYIFKIEFELLTLSEVNRQCTYVQEVVNKAVNFINQHYPEDTLTLSRVSEEVHLSPFYFSHIFKKELHTTFVEYLTKVRLKEAVRMLKEDRKKTVKEISYTVGYEDPYYFSKVFSKHYKVSPKRFRERYA